jgi:TetR/AcrR family transcriptional regulator, transcriptional repressor for nem operon
MTADSQSPKRRRRRNDPVGLQARILDRAAKLFQERGFHATSMHDVMSATGVSAGALHHHFPTKKSLALAVLAQRVRPAVQEAWIDPILQTPALGKGVAQVFASIVAGITARGSVSGCPLNNLALELSLADVELRKGIDAVFSEWRAVLGEKIAGTRGGARLDSKGRAAAANFIISVYSGAMNMAKAAQSATPLADAASVLSNWLRAQQLAS